MAETVYSAQRTLLLDRLVVVSMNGGSLTVEARHGPGVWVVAETIADGEVKTVDARGREFRFTPSAGSYAIS